MRFAAVGKGIDFKLDKPKYTDPLKPKDPIEDTESYEEVPMNPFGSTGFGTHAGRRYASRNINTDTIREFGVSPAAAITDNGRDPDILSVLESQHPGVTAKATFEYASGGIGKNPINIHKPQHKIAPRNPEYYLYGQPNDGDFNEIARKRRYSRRSNMPKIKGSVTTLL